LFAHQDDEFGVFAALEQAVSVGSRPVCLYLTDGASTVPAQRRDAESRAVLRQLGVAEADMHFIGSRLSFADGRLYEHCEQALDAARQEMAAYPAPTRVYLHAWEGGHQDHDAAHVISLALAQHWPQADLRQFALYHGARLPGSLFRVLAPLAENGPVQRQPVPWPARRRHLRLCASYPSQRKTWIALFPFVLWHMLRGGAQQTQAVNLRCITQRPHAGPLLYESRGAASWQTLKAALTPFITNHFVCP
jgi:LmbE family N-acetylglucosaminyl deacetylase